MLKKLTLKIGSSPREEVVVAPTLPPVVPAPKETFIQKMKNFTARKWSHSPTDIFTTTSKIELGCWNRQVEEGHFDASGDNLTDGSAMSIVTTNNTVAEAPPQTFVCPHRNCHKIFNSRANWKRHQTLHRKKEEAAAATAAAAVGSTNEESIVVNVESDSPPGSDVNASSMVSNSTSPKTQSTTTTIPSPPNKIKLVLNINRNK